MRMPIHVHIVMRGLIHVHAHAHAHAYTHVHAHAYTHAIVYACLYMGTEHVRRGWGFRAFVAPRVSVRNVSIILLVVVCVWLPSSSSPLLPSYFGLYMAMAYI